MELGFLLQPCGRLPLIRTTHVLCSTLYDMTQDYRGPAFSQDHSKGRGSVSGDVREMLDAHSMTKTDGLKKWEQLSISPSPGGPGISSTLDRKK